MNNAKLRWRAIGGGIVELYHVLALSEHVCSVPLSGKGRNTGIVKMTGNRTGGLILTETSTSCRDVVRAKNCRVEPS